MDFQLAGYYVMRLNKYYYAPGPDQLFFTVCTLFNDNLLNYREWDRPEWLDREAIRALENIETLFLPNLDLEEVINWIYQKEQEGKLEWPFNFSDLATAYEYRDRFFLSYS